MELHSLRRALDDARSATATVQVWQSFVGWIWWPEVLPSCRRESSQNSLNGKNYNDQTASAKPGLEETEKEQRAASENLDSIKYSSPFVTVIITQSSRKAYWHTSFV